VERVPAAAVATASASAATEIGGRVDVFPIPLQREVKMRTTGPAGGADTRNICARVDVRTPPSDEARQVVVPGDETIPEPQLELVARRRVPGATDRAVPDSLQHRAMRHRPVDALVTPPASAEPITARVGARERHTELHQATRRITKRAGAVTVQRIKEARSLTAQIILRFLTDHVLIRMHNTSGRVLRPRPRVPASVELAHLRERRIKAELLGDVVEVPLDVLVVDPDDPVNRGLHPVLDLAPGLQDRILHRGERRLDVAGKGVDLRLHRVLDPVDNRLDRLRLHRVPRGLYRVAHDVEAGLYAPKRRRDDLAPRRVPQPRDHGVDHAVLHELPSGLERVTHDVEAGLDRVDDLAHHGPGGVTEPDDDRIDRGTDPVP